MSEVITASIAVGAVVGCAAVGVGYVTCRALSWLSDQAQQQAQRLEQELAASIPSHTTTNQARQTLEQQSMLIKAQAAKATTLRPRGDAVARVLALKHSALGRFVDKTQWNELCASPPRTPVFNTVVNQAADKFTKANATYISDSIAEVAAEAGFTDKRINRLNNGKRVVVMADRLGRAVVAEVKADDDGAQIQLDLTGFGDGSCHGVMNSILDGLSAKEIRLNQMQRRSHYRRDGAGASGVENWKTDEQAATRITPEEPYRRAEMRRRRHYSPMNQLGHKR